MKVSLVLAHPYGGSFNASVAETAAAALRGHGHTVFFHDLYREGFDPVLPAEELLNDMTRDGLVALHQREIREAGGIVIVHPNWWGQPPAMLKGWTDRVLREGVAYAFPEGDNGGGLPVGLLKAQAAVVFNTSNTPEERERAVFGDPLERMWKDCIFDFCGVRDVRRRMFRVVADSTAAQRALWLREVEDMVRAAFPQNPSA